LAPDTATAPRPHYVTTPRGQVRLWLAGQGPTLIALPGLIRSAETVARELARTCPGWRVVAVELPGIGYSAGAGIAGIKDMAARIADALERHGLVEQHEPQHGRDDEVQRRDGRDDARSTPGQSDVERDCACTGEDACEDREEDSLPVQRDRNRLDADVAGGQQGPRRVRDDHGELGRERPRGHVGDDGPDAPGQHRDQRPRERGSDHRKAENSPHESGSETSDGDRGDRDGPPSPYLNRKVSRFFGANVRML